MHTPEAEIGQYPGSTMTGSLRPSSRLRGPLLRHVPNSWSEPGVSEPDWLRSQTQGDRRVERVAVSRCWPMLQMWSSRARLPHGFTSHCWGC